MTLDAAAVADRIAIQELCSRYAWTVDNYQIDPLMALFVDDNPLFDESPAGLARSEGVETIRAYYEGLFSSLAYMVHLNANFFLEELGKTEARGKISAHVHAATKDGMKFDVMCWYDDVYRRTSEGWKFVSRVVNTYVKQDIPVGDH